MQTYWLAYYSNLLRIYKYTWMFWAFGFCTHWQLFSIRDIFYTFRPLWPFGLCPFPNQDSSWLVDEGRKIRVRGWTWIQSSYYRVWNNLKKVRTRHLDSKEAVLHQPHRLYCRESNWNRKRLMHSCRSLYRVFLVMTVVFDYKKVFEGLFSPKKLSYDGFQLKKLRILARVSNYGNN